MDQATKDTIVNMYAAKIGIADICAECGVYPSDVYRVIREYGMTPMRRHKLTPGSVDRVLGATTELSASMEPLTEELPIDTDIAIQVYQAKVVRRCSNATLAKELGVSTARVSALLKRASKLLVPGVDPTKWADVRREIGEWMSATRSGETTESLDSLALRLGVELNVVSDLISGT